MEQKTVGLNKAKGWQIALFPFNNAATNVYFAFYNYFVYWAVLALTNSVGTAIGGVLVSSVLAIAVSTFASLFAPLMRVFDGVTDPILGGMMDKTRTKLGKFRPFMIIGNVMLAFSVLMMMFVSRLAGDIMWLQWTFYIVSYIIYVLGYTCQCAVTKAGQTCLTNDPKQRSQFVIWNMIGMIGSIVLVNVMAGGVLTNEAICQKGMIVYEQTAGTSLTNYGVYSLRELLEKLSVDYLSVSNAAEMSTAELVGLLENNETLKEVMSTLVYDKGYSYVYGLTEAGKIVIERSDVYTLRGMVEALSFNVFKPSNGWTDALAFQNVLDVPTQQLITQLLTKNINIASLGLETGKTYTYLRGAAYGAQFYDIMVPFVIIVSGVYTAMAVAAIWEKDKPEFWGVASEPAKFKDYIGILKGNKEIRWLVLSSGLNKLASTIATSGAVAFMLYGCLMGDYNGLFIPFYALCFVFMGIFFLWGSNTAGKKGQKRGVAQFTVFAILFYIGVLIMLCIYDHGNPNTWLSLYSMEGGFHLTINAYTIIFIILYGCGYGAFNCCDNLTIPMVADCTDYETYRSGKYVPGIMGTIFSLVDKLISSLQTLLLQLFIVFLVPGLNGLPAEDTPYMPGMEISTIICFCVLPMIAWIVTVFCMTRYGLSGKKLQEIQAVNAVRKHAVQGGMSMEQAMATWQTIDQVPAMFIPAKKPRINKKTGEVIEEKENWLDKVYNKIFTKRERTTSAEPSSNAIPIPEEFVIKEEAVPVTETTENTENIEK